IPSFAVGRTQELAYRFNLMWEAGELPPVDVYVDTPLGVNATDVYKLHPECFDAKMLRQMEIEADRDPLGFDRLTYIRDANASRRLNDLDGPAIIVAPSGMCTGGRIMHHLMHHGGKKDTTILFVGYQAHGTTGRKILEGAEKVRIYGKEFRIRAKVRKGASYSAHADRTGLIEWLEGVRERGAPKRVFLVHGEEAAARALAGELEDRGFPGVEVPERGVTYEL
ncbi:MAG: MBL fold metallo-hydrolase, partial [Gemmatimonadetes bacterium]|nr:MBL fold metallo-hydrolase [Gemmatimonadota bacterium]